MWFIFNLKKEFKKIFNSFEDFKNQLSNQKIEIEKNKQNISELKIEIVSRREVDLIIREHLLKVQSIPPFEHNSNATPDKTNFEQVILRKAKKTRPTALKQRIKGYLEDNMRTTDIYNILVEDNKVIGKSQFFHYLSIVKAELLNKTSPKIEPNFKTN